MLKHRYFRACDAKDPEVMRTCFIAKGADIYYGPRSAASTTPTDSSTSIRVSHFSASTTSTSSSICITGCTRVSPLKARIPRRVNGLRFRQVDLRARTERVTALDYDDDYVIENGEWKISRCHVKVLWSIERTLTDDVKVVQ